MGWIPGKTVTNVTKILLVDTRTTYLFQIPGTQCEWFIVYSYKAVKYT